MDSDSLSGVGLLFSNLDGLSGVEGDKDTNNSMNNSHVLDHSVSHISNESDNDTAEALNDQLFWAATFDRCTSGNKIIVPEECDCEPTGPTLTTQSSSETHLSARVTDPEFLKTIASKLAPSYNSSLVDNHPCKTSCASKPSIVKSTSTMDTEMF